MMFVVRQRKCPVSFAPAFYIFSVLYMYLTLSIKKKNYYFFNYIFDTIRLYRL